MMDYSIKFWDRIAARYAKKPVTDEATYQKKLAVTQQYFRPDMKVLEFGCGTGSTAIVHAPQVNTYQAIDVSPKMIAIAKRKLVDKQIDNLTFSPAAPRYSFSYCPSGSGMCAERLRLTARTTASF